MAEVWAGFENYNKKKVFTKLILKEVMKSEAASINNSVNSDRLFRSRSKAGRLGWAFCKKT